MGEGRYRTLLCLVQLAVPDHTAGLRIELIDPLEEHLDGAPLAGVLADPEVEVVVHAGRQDIALLRRRFDTPVRNVFDTQVAAGFAGMAAQASYETLLARCSACASPRARASRAGTRARSRASSSPTRARTSCTCSSSPGSCSGGWAPPAACSGRGRSAALVEESSDERDEQTIFARLPRIRNLSAVSQAIARELVAWRERTAAAQDRTVQSVLADAALVELAKRRPATMRELEQIRGLGQGGLRRRGAGAAGGGPRRRRAADGPQIPLERLARGGFPDPADAPLVALCEALVRARAREADLAYELIAARADLQAVVAAVRTRRAGARRAHAAGWRRELVGAELLELLDGRAVAVGARGGAGDRP